jgi:hypothetical protein
VVAMRASLKNIFGWVSEWVGSLLLISWREWDRELCRSGLAFIRSLLCTDHLVWPGLGSLKRLWNVFKTWWQRSLYRPSTMLRSSGFPHILPHI